MVPKECELIYHSLTSLLLDLRPLYIFAALGENRNTYSISPADFHGGRGGGNGIEALWNRGKFACCPWSIVLYLDEYIFLMTDELIQIFLFPLMTSYINTLFIAKF